MDSSRRVTPSWGAEEITVFDATGLAIQDVAVAAYVYEAAVARNVGKPLDMG